MPWFKVDDTLANHPKARAAGLAAMGLWVVAGSYAAQYLTEGAVPEWFVLSWPNGKRCAQALVKAGLWDDAEDGWQFHQWTERQPTKEQVEAEREANRERLKKWRANRAGNAASNAVTPAVTNGVSNGLPNPTRPDLIKETTGAPKRGTRIPDDWKPTPENVAWQREQGISDLLARRELPKFIDYWQAQSGQRATKTDWPATWRNWLRTALEREPKAAASVPRYDGNGGW